MSFILALTISYRYHSRRSRSREIVGFNSSGSGRRKNEDERKLSRSPDQEICEQKTNLKDNYKRKSRTSDTDSDRERLDMEGDRGKHHKCTRKSSINKDKGDDRRSRERGSDVDWDAITGDRKKLHGSEGRSSRQRNRDNDEVGPEDHADRDRDRKRHHKKKSSRRRRSRDYRNVTTSDTEFDRGFFDKDAETEAQHDCSRRSSKHTRSDLPDYYENYENKNDEVYGDWSMGKKERRAHRHDSRKSSKHRKTLEYIDDHGEENVNQDNRGDW